MSAAGLLRAAEPSSFTRPMTTESRQVPTTWRKNKVAGILLVCLIVYALLGFLLAPWLAGRIATSKVQEVLGAELRVDDIAINPFTFTIDILGLEFDHPSGAPVARIERIHINLEPTALFGKTLVLSEARVERPAIVVRRDTQGEINLASIKPLASAPEQSANEAGEARWPLVIKNLEIRNMTVQLIDDTVEPAAELGVDGLNLNASNVSTQPGLQFPASISMNLTTGGSIAAEGDITLLPEPSVALTLTLEDVSPELLHPYIKPLADIALSSGYLNFDGDITTGPDDPFSLTGNAEVVDLILAETDGGTRLGSWNRLAVEQIDFSLIERRLGISQIIADAAYADILIAEDGRINLKRASKGYKTTETGPAEPEAAAEPQDESASMRPPFDVTIGRIVINDSAAAFEDRSLPLPFSAQIDQLNGQLSTIATSSSEPSEISFEGRVDEFGQVVVAGHLTPLDPKRNTRVDVSFINVDMPKFSAYTIRFAGRAIESGKLDLVLGYTVTESQLVGDNNIVLREFELGDEVLHPGAANLPLGLAVALLKDPSGRINVDLPIRGDVDDPEFDIGSVVGTAFGNLITGIALAPFKFLGKLLGINSSDLEALSFAPGRADLSPPQQEIAAKFAEALTMRPALVLEIPGAYHADADGLALREKSVDARIDADMGNSASYAERRVEVIESLFTSRVGEPLPAADDEIDRFARAAELRQRLIEIETLPDDSLEMLAHARAENLRDAILASDATLESRVLTQPAITVLNADDSGIKMATRFTTQQK